MKKIKQEKGITLSTLVITIIVLLILTSTLIYNTKGSIRIQNRTKLYNDIELLKEKVSEYYNEYGKIPANIEYTNIGNLSNILSKNNDTGKFYVIDLEAMKGITLNYGKDYEKIKDNESSANSYQDVYIINQNSHNIFYVKGITETSNNITTTYYTDYTQPDETVVDLRYIDGILIPTDYYYIGKTKDNSGNELLVISNNKTDTINTSNTNQYTWTKQSSELEKVPDSVKLDSNQKEYEFLESANYNQGYFKNAEGKVVYSSINEENWSEEYTKEIEYTDKNGDTVKIPEGSKISLAPTMNTIKTGLVIKDKKDNEWVWVEVPKTVFTTATKEDEYDKIKTDLITYAADYREGQEVDEWYAIDGSTLVTASTTGLTNTQKALDNGCGLTYSEYETEYKKMLSSIYTNGGFWISRYEVGDSTATANNTTRKNDSGTTGVAVSKANQIPYNFVTCSQAQKIASEMSDDSNKTGSLLFGIQWDLTCKFFETNSDLTQAEIKSDSTNWGNYKNTSLKLYRGKYNIGPDSSTSLWTTYGTNTTNYVIESQTSNNENYYQLLTTGATKQTKVLNIYDFSGNEWEWTLEKNSNTSAPCICRGACFDNSGSVYPASSRGYETISIKNGEIAFRTTLY